MKQNIESQHGRLETGDWTLPGTKNAALQYIGLDHTPEKENLAWATAWKRQSPQAGLLRLGGSVTCSRLLAFEALPGRGGGGDKLDTGATAPTTAKAHPHASATARTEARAPHTEPAAQAGASTAAGVVASTATSAKTTTKTTAKATSKTSTEATAKATATAVGRGHVVCDDSCRERREDLVRPVC